MTDIFEDFDPACIGHNKTSGNVDVTKGLPIVETFEMEEPKVFQKENYCKICKTQLQPHQKTVCSNQCHVKHLLREIKGLEANLEKNDCAESQREIIKKTLILPKKMELKFLIKQLQAEKQEKIQTLSSMPVSIPKRLSKNNLLSFSINSIHSSLTSEKFEVGSFHSKSKPKNFLRKYLELS